MGSVGSNGVDLQGLANIASITGSAVSISSARGAKKTAKHAKKRAIGKAIELDKEEKVEGAASKKRAKEDRLRLIVGAERNLNLFSSPLGLQGTAQTARKVLTGQ